MSACLCNVFGRILWDDDYKAFFFRDPLAACRVYEGPTAQASGLRGLSRQDFKALDKQIAGIRKTLGEQAMKDIANDFGLQMIIGRAMLEPGFGERLAKDPTGVAKEVLGANESAKKALRVLNSPGFRKLNGFAEHRKTFGQVGAGARFNDAIAHSRVFQFNELAGSAHTTSPAPGE